MKKKLLIFIICIFAFATLTLSAAAANEVSVILDGERVAFDVPPQIISNRTMVPIRAIFEALGAKVEWDAETRTAKATIDGYVVKCTLDSRYMSVRGKNVKMDVSPVIVDGRTLVPARFVAEAFGGVVGWDGDTRTVYITSAASLDVPVFSGNACTTHSFDARGYCTVCGFASDYKATSIDNVVYTVIEDGAEMRIRGYSVEKVIGRLNKGDRITVTMQVTNPFGDVWYLAEKDGKKFIVYSGDVEKANVITFDIGAATDIGTNTFTVNATCHYSLRKPEYIAVYLGTGKTLDLIAETREINGSGGSFTVTCNVGRLKTLLPDTTYFYQIHAYSDGVLHKSEARAVTTAKLPAETTQTTLPPSVPDTPKEDKFLGYQTGYGSAKTAWGKTVVVSVFVESNESSWTGNNTSMQTALSKLKSASDWFAAQCRSFGADTEIVCDWGVYPELVYKMDFSNAPYSAEQALLLDKIDTAGILRQHSADNIVYMLFRNEFAVSGTQVIKSSNTLREYDIVNLYFKGQYDSPEVYGNGEWAATYAHEMMHCFGAYDLYRGANGIPEEYKETLYAQMFERYDNRNDIMLQPHVDEVFEEFNYVSELDAYYIGLIPYCADIDTWGLPKEGIR